ncbi:MAG: hypothetical protein LBL90_04925 [Prevotellaceae bacterium]|jgi:hypothetical protein|nr:hypothetical protein [Prevotellaceae bacterium]
MKRRRYIQSLLSLIACCFLLAALSSCVKRDLCDCCTPEEQLVDYNLTLVFNHMKDTITTTYSTKANSDFIDMHAIIDIYSDDGFPFSTDNQRMERKLHTIPSVKKGKNTATISLKLPAQKLKFLSWIHCGEDNKHFDVEDLCAVKIKSADEPINDSKYAYCGVLPVDISGNEGLTINDTMLLETPFAEYQVIANDLQKFKADYNLITTSDLRTKAVYSMWLPYGYNVMTQDVNYFESDVSFHYNLSEASPESVILISDHVFISKNSKKKDIEPDTEINISFVIYDKNKNIINGADNLAIPLKQAHLTLLTGAFLTKEFAPGSIGIDDGFEGDEIVIILPD